MEHTTPRIAPAALRLALLVLPVSFALVARAQADTAGTATPGKHSVGSIGWHYGQPLSEFSNIREKGLWGLSVLCAWQVGTLPIDAGLGFNLDWSRSSHFSMPVARANTPHTTGQLEAQDRSYALLPLVRVSPLRGAFQCYAELFGGTRLFLNRSTVSADTPYGAIVRTRHLSDFTAEWGLAAGILVRVNKHAHLEARFAYNRGGKTRFVDRDDIALNDQNVLLVNTGTSTTSAWRASIAVAKCF